MVSLEKRVVELTLWETVVVWLIMNYSRIMMATEIGSGGIINDAADLF